METGLPPILVAPLIRTTDILLLDLLNSLPPGEWDLPTIVPNWTVRDITAHLLDTALRKLSLVRDRCFVEKPVVNSPQDFTAFINRLNHEGVAVYRRLSPQILIAVLTSTTGEFADFHEALDPFAQAVFPVSWAGEAESLNWFDTARELTERWHHQQQIRLATNRPGIMTPELYHPVLDTFLRALPHAFRDTPAPTGTTLQIEITGGCGGLWQLTRVEGRWVLTHPAVITENRITIPQDLAWRIFTKGLKPEQAAAEVQTSGDTALVRKVLHLTAIVG